MKTKAKKEAHKKAMKKLYIKNRDKRLLWQRNYKRTKKNKDYNCPLKNKIRNQIIDLINNYQIKTILTLESRKFLFSKLLPSKDIYVYENNLSVYKDMLKNKPTNVSLFFNNISDFALTNKQVDFIYLDLCSGLRIEKPTLYHLKEKIQKSKLFAISLCLRDQHKNQIGNIDCYLINQIQTITEINWKLIYGETYRDGTPMITLLFENPKGGEKE